ncbi:PAS domain S-box protein [Sphingopyxis sp. PAMC25046]|uniref:PAS domain-containing protein n=1 Tax=Sphingopyxis sp. PAMC25046 TaxID=2565556 RepID=UPI00109D8A9F|nr:PAS domain-containing protein [Sphingopyxis sp. PAMC25046]QCB54537.1 PAS domain S-box protein [Sphingopyxis sp. PAMC25046]
MIHIDTRRSLAVLLCASLAGLLIALLGEAAGLIVPITALFLVAPRLRRPLMSALALLLAALLCAALLGGPREALLSWAALLIVALSVGAILSLAPIVMAERGASLDSDDREPIARAPDIHPDDAAAVAQAKARAFWGGVPQVVSYRQRSAGGEWQWAEFLAEPPRGSRIRVDPIVHAPDQAWTVAASLGDTVDAVHAAKIIESLYGAAFAFDASGQFTYATPMAQTSISMTLEDLNRPLGDGAFVDGGDFGWKLGVHPDDYPEAARELRRCLRTGDPYNYEYRVLRATGLYVWHRFAIRPTRGPDGAITGWFGIGFDIDVFRKTEVALLESERSLRELIETAPALIWCMTPKGEPVYFSRHLREFFGFDVEDRDLPGQTRLQSVLGAVIHPDDLDKVNQRFEHSLKTGASYALTHRQRRFDGVYRWVETRIAAMRGEDGEIVQWNGVCLDIEEQVRAQEELRQVQDKLGRAAQAASLAELSASIAHEVNQPLAAIMTNAQACERWLVAEPPNLERARVIVERITRSAQSAADVVSHIRALFSQSSEPRTESMIEVLVGEVVDLLAEDASRRGVQIEVDVANGLSPVAIDPIQIQQVFVNLLRNGMEAMEKGVDDKRLSLSVRGAGQAVLRIEIADRGCGIEDPEKMFDSFFTTKASGMGMGLAICRSIVEAHGGRLWAETNEPVGARLIFTLPGVPAGRPAVGAP